MTKLLTRAGAILGFCVATVVSGAAAENAPSLDPLQGKWTVSKTNRDGRPYSQVIEIKQDKLRFQMRDADHAIRFVAQGTLQTEKAGPFQVLRLTRIEAGRSPDDLQPVDEDRSSIYMLRDDHLFLATNFDRDRQNERPSADEYVRGEALQPSAPAPGAGEAKLLGTWKLEVTMGDNTRDYELRISKPEGKLSAVLVSPRSGERPCRSIQFKDGELVVEVEREIQGNPAVIVYRAKLSGEELIGTVAVKGYEDQFSGKVKATR